MRITNQLLVELIALVKQNEVKTVALQKVVTELIKEVKEKGNANLDNGK